MTAAQLIFVGSGDAFGSGGRNNTCLLATMNSVRFFVDFGSSSLVALKQLGLSYLDIDTFFVTHLHGDHGGALPSLIVESIFVTKRCRALTIAGPAGLRDWISDLGGIMYPGMRRLRPGFDLHVIEMTPLQTYNIAGLTVTPYPARHTPETNPTGLRIEAGGKTLAYSGDTEWNDQLVALAREADVFIIECYGRNTPVPNHMSYGDIQANRDKLDVRRLVLTHTGPDMQSGCEELAEEIAYDGLQISF